MTSKHIYAESKINELISLSLAGIEKNEISPVFLYIKQHSITKLKYFGKTAKSEEDMLRYNGSGVYWTDHLKIHGSEFVDTVWYNQFHDVYALVSFAIRFCVENDVGTGCTDIWANLIIENGLTGGRVGGKLSQITKDKIGLAASLRVGPLNTFFGKHHSVETKKLLSEINTGKISSQETRDKISKSTTGVKKPEGHGAAVSKALTGKKKSKQHTANMGLTHKNKVVCKDILTGEILQVESDNFYRLKDILYVGVMKGSKRASGTVSPRNGLGKRHGAKYEYCVISPSGVVSSNVVLKKICEDYKLCYSSAMSFANKGNIPSPYRSSSVLRENLTNWTIIKTAI